MDVAPDDIHHRVEGQRGADHRLGALPLRKNPQDALLSQLDQPRSLVGRLLEKESRTAQTVGGVVGVVLGTVTSDEIDASVERDGGGAFKDSAHAPASQNGSKRIVGKRTYCDLSTSNRGTATVEGNQAVIDCRASAMRCRKDNTSWIGDRADDYVHSAERGILGGMRNERHLQSRGQDCLSSSSADTPVVADIRPDESDQSSHASGIGRRDDLGTFLDHDVSR